MRRIASALTVLRRTIIIFLVIILAAYYIEQWVDSGKRGINDPMKELKADGAVATIPVGKSFAIDNDTFTADAVYVTNKQIMVTYTYRMKQRKVSWSFPEMSLKLITPDGQQLTSHSGGSSGFSWGARGNVSYGLPDHPADRVMLIYDLYDRYGEIELPLPKVGEGT
ncbi:DUF4179 domain-containing protein [Cohnella terricola]|uniref:DUF4179 domain-containing protein n=1 Tax=Cohnella terricola TaxID=1289167 RepID=A0A559JX05_9BACL|nr:DUF4179 domain-containing protein [Cohnella terricola]TVY04416.1 DUF4179 domain-containing protein [Cohnella terricola]